MNGPTHAVIGVAAGAGLALSTGADQGQAIMMVVASLMTCKLPDLDLQTPFAHRGITHSLLALAAVYVGMMYLFPSYIAWAALAGYASHIAADVVTQHGVMLFYPLPYHVRLGLISTGGLREDIFRALMIGVILVLAFQWVQL